MRAQHAKALIITCKCNKCGKTNTQVTIKVNPRIQSFIELLYPDRGTLHLGGAERYKIDITYNGRGD